MKNIFIVLILVFLSNIFASTGCCISSLNDSIRAVPDHKWASYPYTATFYPLQDAAYNINPCDSFKFTYRVTAANGYDVTKVWYYKKIDSVSYSHCLFRVGVKTLTCDTVRNWCNLNSSIENKSIILNEEILNIKVYNIQGRLVYSGNNIKIKGLTGFYIIKYITDKREYFQKKIIY